MFARLGVIPLLVVLSLFGCSSSSSKANDGGLPHDAGGPMDTGTPEAGTGPADTTVAGDSGGDASTSSVALVQVVAPASGGSMTTVPLTEKPGDLLIVAVYWSFGDGGTLSVADTNGIPWTHLMAGINANTKAQLWYGSSGLGGNDMVTVSAPSGADMGVVVLEYSGIVPSGALDTNAAGVAGSVTMNMTTGSFSTSSPNDLIVALFVDSDLTDGETMTVGTGFSKRALDPGFVAMVEDNSPYTTAAGAHDATAAIATADMSWIACVAAFRSQ